VGNAAVMYACAHTAAGFEHMLEKCWQTVQREQTMKRSAILGPQFPELPIAWRDAGYAALRTNATDTCDDRVSENIFDVEDERAEVDIIAHKMIRGAS
jgi:hypothetical protein